MLYENAAASMGWSAIAARDAQLDEPVALVGDFEPPFRLQDGVTDGLLCVPVGCD